MAGTKALQIKRKVTGDRVHQVEQKARTVWLKIRMEIKKWKEIKLGYTQKSENARAWNFGYYSV